MTHRAFFYIIRNDVLSKKWGVSLMRYKEVDIYENDVSAEEETEI